MLRTEKLFQFFAEEHDMILLDGQINDIIHAVEQAAWTDPVEFLPCDGEKVIVYDPENFMQTKQVRTIRYSKTQGEWFKRTFPRWRYPLYEPEI